MFQIHVPIQHPTTNLVKDTCKEPNCLCVRLVVTTPEGVLSMQFDSKADVLAWLGSTQLTLGVQGR